MTIDGPPGKYRFLATFLEGAAATGGDVEFYVTDRAQLPPVETEIVLCGEDPELAAWLTDHDIRTRPFALETPAAREVILVSGSIAEPQQDVFCELARRMARGATVIFLTPEVLRRGDQPVGWLPLANKGTLSAIHGWLYLKDEWSKRHPIFDGLPSGGLMDYAYYRELIPDAVWSGQEPPAEAVAGAIKASQDYAVRADGGCLPPGLGTVRAQYAAHSRQPPATSGRRSIVGESPAVCWSRCRTSHSPHCRPISTRSSARWAIWNDTTVPGPLSDRSYTTMGPLALRH